MKDCKQQWWKDAGLGMFIHWGLYAKLAGAWNGKQTNNVSEWIMRHLEIPVESYRKLAECFCPTDFDAKQ